MVSLESRKLESILKLAVGIAALVVLNLLASRYFHRFDLTSEGRYTIKPATRQMLENLDDVVYVEVFLDGELNAGFKRLQRSVRETLEEFRIYSGNNVQYTFKDPSAALGESARNQFMQSLSQLGIQPTNIIEEKDGQRNERLIFPGAIISYGGAERGVMLLRGNQASSPEEKLNESIESIEYSLASAIFELTNIEQKQVGIVKGHGELDSLESAGLELAVQKHYTLRDIRLGSDDLGALSAMIIAKPEQPFNEREKYALDQYLMSGGKVLMLIDKLQANMDSASNEFNYAFPFDLNIDDQLFRYGIRVNNTLIQDISSAKYPIVIGSMGDQPQIQLIQWPFYPLINRFADHPVTNNLNAVKGRFMSTIDTVKAEGLRKTPLMFTSDYSRSLSAPVKVSIQDLRENLSPDKLTQKNLPVAYLIEGEFRSLYENRYKPEGTDESSFIARSSDDAKLLVIGDGDIARNDINTRNGMPQVLGYDPFEQTTFGNEDLLMNALHFMIDEKGLITARNKEIEIRPLDKVKIANERTYWQIINLIVPVLILIIFGIVRSYWRKRKFTGFKTNDDAA
ncbi:gliding motility-associated ABC transporter substrate-binding protein GldG [Fulvivirga sedimenti]|uniref:Gliding motility-associated ABC transporter substrate-binding protein GldG n=1 Tax=Fulvivirga sedimenti TaxID=2879465 RepID=A0A9X1HN36_9BACT|nr:gliding motility-associated ABC transporter substrate-binding protein GldG [Fulvivirga sedimenti]MCA6073853.1 gliding motility-associated ABC transporter substrate-binding protein GldG [Fulvivirga sedimenti]